MDKRIVEIIEKALAEDIGAGDITTSAVLKNQARGKGIFLLKSSGVIAGMEIVKEVFSSVDKRLQLTQLSQDGEFIKSGTVIAEVKGNLSSILTGERTALNFLQRMSGIATAAYSLASKIRHTKAKIIDTRKTVPGLRFIDKMAVRIGGCSNHRMGLYDMFLVKDNHIAAAGSITAAVEACIEYKVKNNIDAKIEVETTNLDEVKEALQTGADVIMLDNFSVPDMKTAVELSAGKCLLEASGMVNEETVVPIAETGVDYISVGAITHSVRALDISLEIEKE